METEQFGHWIDLPQDRQETNLWYPRRLRKRIDWLPAALSAISRSASTVPTGLLGDSPRMSQMVTDGRRAFPYRLVSEMRV